MSDRRDFLKKVLTLSVFTATTPKILLGELQPVEVLENKDEGIFQDIYVLDLEEYPDLMEDYGSIEIEVPDTQGNKHTLYVTRVPKELSKRRFSALLNICPHENMFVNPLHPDLHTFECTGHGSIFDPLGKWVSGPAAAPLTDFVVRSWNEDDRYLRIMIDFYKASSVDSPSMQCYLSRNYPNPFANKTTLRYGIDRDASINFEIYDVLGNKLITTPEQFLAPGDYEYTLNMSGYPIGKYFARMMMNGLFIKSITLNKER